MNSYQKQIARENEAMRQAQLSVREAANDEKSVKGCSMIAYILIAIVVILIVGYLASKGIAR